MTPKTTKKYMPQNIESKWQQKWIDTKRYVFTEEKNKDIYYNLVELPYPSGDLHLGHWFAFVPPDAHARFMKMSGKNVFFPNGFDAFGLPAENAAIKRGIHPRDWTLSNIERMRGQFETMGTMIDWSHQAVTCEPEYYRWNQWIFLQFFKKGLAYRGKTLSNWCPSCQTVLANEAIEDGKCWRCGTTVVQKEIEQWFLRITDYADKLIWENTDKPDSNGVNWPRSVREGQNNWIGRSEGAVISFSLENNSAEIEVFTTRPDTLYGATFLVVAPEHAVVASLLNTEFEIEKLKTDEVKKYVQAAGQKTELERKEQKEKTGIFTGLFALHPKTGEKLPVWVADYVLSGYGTGAIMAVPAHDERDFEFAKKFDLPIKEVIEPEKQKKVDTLYTGYGKLINSGEWDGLVTPLAMPEIIASLEKESLGSKKTTYHLHDWSVSRQRYWGTPVPIIHCEKCGLVPVPEENLPVELPYEVDYTPKGKPPLATAEDWIKVKCPSCGDDARRDAETLDTFFDSSWYYYRYMNPKYTKGPFDPEQARKIMPVSLYSGGAEHTLGHTLYARFFTKFFKDLGLIEFEEFAKKRIQHGIILGTDGQRMSKSRGNVVNPDDVVKEYGSDAVRVYLCFMMPYEDTVAPWNPRAIAGIYRFLTRTWGLAAKIEEQDLSPDDLYWMHKTIKKVGDDLRLLKFNTAVAALMEWLNYLCAKENVCPDEYKTLIVLLAPFAPHITEELWHELELGSGSVHDSDWPVFDESYIVRETVTVAVQVNGKLRAQINVESSAAQSQVEEQAKAEENIKKHLADKEIVKVVYVQGKILNFVVR